MKKFLLPIAAMLLCMTACNKDNESILKLEVEQYTSDAKAHLDSENYVVWDNNDMVKVNGANHAVSVSGTSATLAGVQEASTYTALYPASWASTDGASIIYPRTQTYRTNGTAQVIDAPMAAYATSGNLKFHNLGAILAVNVTGISRVETIKVVADGTTAINGTCTISDITTGSPSLGAPTSGTNTTTLECNGVTVPSDGMTFYIALPTVEAKLTITIDDGYSRYSKTQGNAMSFATNHGYNVPFDASTATVDQYAPTIKQIWYKSNSGPISNFDNYGIGTLVSNEYNSTLGYYVATYSSDVTSLPDRCFQYNGDLTEIILPEGVTSIGYDAFLSCGSLSKVVLPYSVTFIEQAFWNCSSLQTLEIPNPDAKIANIAFLNSGLRTLILHTNNPIPEDDLMMIPMNFESQIRDYYYLYDEYYIYYIEEEDMSDEDAVAAASEDALAEALSRAKEYFWSLNPNSKIHVYVPNVTECTNISYDLGCSDVLGYDYIYKPWQYLIDNNKVELHALSSL